MASVQIVRLRLDSKARTKPQLAPNVASCLLAPAKSFAINLCRKPTRPQACRDARRPTARQAASPSKAARASANRLQIGRLSTAWRALGIEVVTTREPGGSESAEILARNSFVRRSQAARSRRPRQFFRRCTDRSYRQDHRACPVSGEMGGIRPFLQFHARLPGRRGRDRAAAPQCARAGHTRRSTSRPDLDPDLPAEEGLARAARRRARKSAVDRFEGEDLHFTRRCARLSSRSRRPIRSAAQSSMRARSELEVAEAIGAAWFRKPPPRRRPSRTDKSMATRAAGGPSRRTPPEADHSSETPHPREPRRCLAMPWPKASFYRPARQDQLPQAFLIGGPRRRRQSDARLAAGAISSRQSEPRRRRLRSAVSHRIIRSRAKSPPCPIRISSLRREWNEKPKSISPKFVSMTCARREPCFIGRRDGADIASASSTAQKTSTSTAQTRC